MNQKKNTNGTLYKEVYQKDASKEMCFYTFDLGNEKGVKKDK